MTFKKLKDPITGKDNTSGIKAKHPSNGVKIDTQLILDAIRKHRGNISRAADMLGVTRGCLQLRSEKEDVIKQTIAECRERFIDETENVLQNKVLDGDTTSVLFTLKTIGRKRGYECDRDIVVESATRGVLDFMLNQSKNPAES